MSTGSFDQVVRDELREEEFKEIRREERERDAQDAAEGMAEERDMVDVSAVINRYKD